MKGGVGDGTDGDEGKEGEGVEGGRDGGKGEEGEDADGFEGAAAGMDRLMLPSQRNQWSGSHPPVDEGDLDDEDFLLFLLPLRRLPDLELPSSPNKPLTLSVAKNRSVVALGPPPRGLSLRDSASSRTRRFRRRSICRCSWCSPCDEDAADAAAAAATRSAEVVTTAAVAAKTERILSLGPKRRRFAGQLAAEVRERRDNQSMHGKPETDSPTTTTSPAKHRSNLEAAKRHRMCDTRTPERVARQINCFRSDVWGALDRLDLNR